MSQVPRQMESTQPTSVLYMALELGSQQWHLAFGIGLASPVRRRQIRAGARDVIRHEIAQAKRRFGLPMDAPVRSCYEAGRDAFWVHRLLTADAIENVVVDSSSITVDRRQRQAKTDRLDAEKLLRLLVRHGQGECGVWKVVHVPTAEVEDARHTERAIDSLVTDRTRLRNRLRGLLAQQGIRTPLTSRFGEQLPHLVDGTGRPVLVGMQRRLAAAWRHLTWVEHALRAARQAQRAEVRTGATAAAARAARLQQLRGIQYGSALVLAKELFARDLRNRREVGALSGLVSVPYQSGQAARDQGIARGGLRHIRGRIVELAWVWIKWQPTSALTRWYQRRFAAGGARWRRIGIVAVARKLLIALWRYSEQGVVPAGAKLRA